MKQFYTSHKRTALTLKYNRFGVARSSQFPEYHQFDTSVYANVCFLLHLSESSLKLAPRLLTRLLHPDNVIIVHIDAKVRDDAVRVFNKSLSTWTNRYRNVYILPRESVTYPGITLLLNSLNAMEFALDGPQQWDYFINLSGNDYPLVSVKNIRNILGQPRVLEQRVSFQQFGNRITWFRKKHEHFNVLHFDTGLNDAPGSRKRVRLFTDGQKRPKSLRKLGIEYAKSEAWIIANRSIVRQSVRSNYARRLLVLLGNTRSSPEHFFSTLAWNTHLNRTTAHQALRAIFLA